MGDEAIDGSKVGTKLIMFVAIIGLVLVAFLVGKNLINKGVDSMEQSAQSIDESRFSDYNGKTVRGRAVRTAVDNFANDDVAILINNIAMNDSAGSSEINSLKSDGANIVTVTGAKGSMESSSSSSGFTTVSNPQCVNYVAVLDATSISAAEGEAVYDKDFKTDSTGTIERYMKKQNFQKKGQIEYIADSGSYKCSLIRNKSKEIVGIICIQQPVY